MTKINDLLAFLAEHNIHPEAADTPWPVYTPDMGELFPVDYPWLLPSRGDRNWSLEDLADAIEQVMEPPNLESHDHARAGQGGGGDETDPRLAHWDVCAWYQQIHFYGREWGIFIRQDCLIRQARQIYAEAGRGGAYVALHALFASLAVYFLHEHFHHKAESLAIRLQVVQPSVRRYPDYWYGVYNKTLGTDDCLEEALANADSWRRLNEQRHVSNISAHVRQAARRYLDRQFPSDPPGYRKAPQFLGEKDFRGGLYLLSSQIDEAMQLPSRVTTGRQRDWYWAPHMSRSLFSWAARIHLIVPPGARPALPRGPLHHVP